MPRLLLDTHTVALEILFQQSSCLYIVFFFLLKCRLLCKRLLKKKKKRKKLRVYITGRHYSSIFINVTGESECDTALENDPDLKRERKKWILNDRPPNKKSKKVLQDRE